MSDCVACDRAPREATELGLCEGHVADLRRAVRRHDDVREAKQRKAALGRDLAAVTKILEAARRRAEAAWLRRHGLRRRKTGEGYVKLNRRATR